MNLLSNLLSLIQYSWTGRMPQSGHKIHNKHRKQGGSGKTPHLTAANQNNGLKTYPWIKTIFCIILFGVLTNNYNLIHLPQPLAVVNQKADGAEFIFRGFFTSLTPVQTPENDPMRCHTWQIWFDVCFYKFNDSHFHIWILAHGTTTSGLTKSDKFHWWKNITGTWKHLKLTKICVAGVFLINIK